MTFSRVWRKGHVIFMGLLIVSSIITSTWYLAEKQTVVGEKIAVISEQLTKLVSEVERGKSVAADLTVRVTALEVARDHADTSDIRFWTVDWPDVGRRLDRLEQFILNSPTLRER